MAKYMIVKGDKRQDGTQLYWINDTVNEKVFNGYSFMGDAEWEDYGGDAQWMELDEAEATLEDLIASDDDIMPDYAKAYQEMIKQGESLEDLNMANHFALENGLITLEEFLKAARVLALQIINR